MVFKQKVNGTSGNNIKTRSFEFEKVFNDRDDQQEVFKDISPLLTSLLDG